MTWRSKYFTYEELITSGHAMRAGIKNIPSAVIAKNLEQTAFMADEIRELLGPCHVDSGYRSKELNRVIGGSSTSAHCLGWAIDFICPSFGTPLKCCQAIVAAKIPFDQLIYEGRWVHISFDPKMRNSILTARFSNGKVHYLNGLVP